MVPRPVASSHHFFSRIGKAVSILFASRLGTMRHDVALSPPQNHHSYPQTSPHRSRQAWSYRTCYMHVIRGTSERTYILLGAGRWAKEGRKKRVLSCHICMLCFLQGSEEQISSGRFAELTRVDTALGALLLNEEHCYQECCGTCMRMLHICTYAIYLDTACHLISKRVLGEITAIQGGT